MKERVSGEENEWRQRRQIGEIKGRRWKREQRNRLNYFAHISFLRMIMFLWKTSPSFDVLIFNQLLIIKCFLLLIWVGK